MLGYSDGGLDWDQGGNSGKIAGKYIGLSAEYGTKLTLSGDYSITSSSEQRLQLLSLGLAWLF